MAILETLLWTVGPAIGKGILATWLGDAEVTKEVTGSLIDLLAVKTSDRIAQRRGARHFEQIGEQVAESLLPLFEGKGRDWRKVVVRPWRMKSHKR